MAEVEMRPAYEWTCEACGRDQFESCRVADWSPEDRLAHAKEVGLIEGWETELPDDFEGDFVTYPDAVTCSDCGAEFTTRHMAE